MQDMPAEQRDRFEIRALALRAFIKLRRKIMLAIGAAFLTVIAVLALRLGTEFLPHLEEGNFWTRGKI